MHVTIILTLAHFGIVVQEQDGKLVLAHQHILERWSWYIVVQRHWCIWFQEHQHIFLHYLKLNHLMIHLVQHVYNG